MEDTIFRKYDIRGKVGSELVIDEIYDLTRAIVFYFLEQRSGFKTCVVGMDGRNHSPAIKEQVCKALIDSGINVIFIGTCPSPVLYFAMHRLPVQAGIMITASHNPGKYNGLKLCLGKKTTVWGDQIQEIKKLFHEKKRIKKGPLPGKYKEEDFVDYYINWMPMHFSNLVGSDISVLIDCGNGAAGTVLPQLIEKMNWKNVELLFEEVDGNFPNHEADPTVKANMVALKKALKISNYDFGIGLDGDCDRVAAMTKSGFLVPGDQLLSIFAKSILRMRTKSVIVFDVKSSSGLIELIKKWRGKPCMSPTGHALIKQTMRKNGAILGGELSCHFVFRDRYFGFDDGIYAMLRLFDIIERSKKTLKELISVFPKKFDSREYRIACDEKAKLAIVEDVKNQFAKRSDVSIITIDGIRVAMDYGWGILRASNTEPAISLRFESDSKEGLKKVKNDFFQVMLPYFKEKTLKRKIGL